MPASAANHLIRKGSAKKKGRKKKHRWMLSESGRSSKSVCRPHRQAKMWLGRERRADESRGDETIATMGEEKDERGQLK